MKKPLLRILGSVLLIDGVLTVLFGRRFVRWFRFVPRSNPYRQVIEKLLEIPQWLLRVGAFTEAIGGLWVLGKAPLDVRTIYNNIAGGYSAIDPVWRQQFYPQAHNAFDQVLSKYLPQDGRVLDLGCGVGGNLARLLFMKLPFGAYMGVDLTEAMLARARSRYEAVPNAEFQQLDLLADPLPEGPFDLIVSTWVFEHLPEPRIAVEKTWERLNPGGYMVFLFEIESDSWKSRIFKRIYPFLSARLVREQEVRELPGLVSLDRFGGPLGDLALVIIGKPADSG